MSEPARLRGRIGHFQYLALGFGTMIGSAWVILLGDWLGKAGPGGAIVGFAAGAVVVMAIGVCYAELTARLPEAGSEFIYAFRVYGPELAFVVGWFLVLYFVSVSVFEGLALAWLVEILLPAWNPTPIYSAFGTVISAQTLGVGIAGTGVILIANYRGARLAVIGHSILTYGFLAVALVILLSLVYHGRPGNLEPAFATTNQRPWWLGSGAMFAFCAYALNGFQAIPQTIEERSDSMTLRAVGITMLAAIAAAAFFYCLAVFAASSIVPWRELVPAPLPMASAVTALPYGDAWRVALLVVTAASLLKAWNGVVMMAARVVVAMARVGQLPTAFARLHPRFGSPALALLCIALLNAVGLLLGRGAIEPITDMCAMVLTLTYVMCCVTVLRMRHHGNAPQFDVPGGTAVIWIGTIGALFMVVVAFTSPFWEQSGVPLEWRLLIAWSLTGAAVWSVQMRRAKQA